MKLTQTGQQLILEAPSALGQDKLLLTEFSGDEKVSDLFSFHLQMLSNDAAIHPEDIVGKAVAVTLKQADGNDRYFNGFVSNFAYGGTDDLFSHYTAEVVPWLWFLKLTFDCRVFQNMSAPDIIKQIFDEMKFSDFETSEIKDPHPKRDYCVQYRESDFDFVSRLMEEEGIFYYFRHEQKKHVLVLADQMGAFKACAENDLEFVAHLNAQPGKDRITKWEHRYQFHSGKWAQTDYNFETPTASLMTNSSTVVRWNKIKSYEVFHYPATYVKMGKQETEARKKATAIRMEETEVPHDVVEGAGVCRSFTSGGKFKLVKHHSKAEEGKIYAILNVGHSVSLGGAYQTGGSKAMEYNNRFKCIPLSTPFRPARTTPKRIVYGAQTAVVVGPAGEEIYTDEHARVKVQFHWDRYGKFDDKSSCWVRVSHANAGKGWGSMITPRIGQEVIVEFLEGDPDRPIITGRVYNADQKPPYASGQGVVSGLKSNTHKGSGSNEMSMDDTAGKEKITIHGQYDMNTSVGHDQTNTVSNNRSTNVSVDDAETVGGKQTINVAGHQKIEVGSGQELKVTGDQVTDVTAHQAVTVGSGQDVIVTGVQKLESTGKQTLKAGGGQDLEVTGKQSVHATGEIEISSDAKIKLSAGGSSIEIGPSGITIEAAAKVTVKGATINLN